MTNRRFFSLRYKIIIAFLCIGLALSSVLGAVSYRILEDKLFSELRRNVGNITRIGAELLDKDALAALRARQGEGLSPEQIDSFEKSGEYRIVSDQLNFIRDTEKDLIRYVYLVAPTDDPGNARYLVDADVIALKEEGADEGEISHFNSDLDVTPFPVMQRALQDKARLVEEDFVYDEAFEVNTVSGYAPVFAKDGKTLLALLGMDMSDVDVQLALEEVMNKSIIVACLSLLASFLTAIIMGTWVTRGIVKLDNLVASFANRDFAVRSHLRSNDEVGRLGFSFNHMAETIQEYSARLEDLVNAYGRFVPHDLLRLLDKKSIIDVNLGDQVQKDMSVLFSDIRDFTSMSEAMSPKDNFDFINSYLSRVGPEIRSHNGIIDKYIGDAVMALFPGKVEDAIDAALEMQRKIREYNGHRQSVGHPPIKVGVGVHTGKVMLGTIGEDQRMDGTVISDAVNLASRIESLTKRYGCNVIVSNAALSGLDDPGKYFIRLVDKVYVAGKNEAVALYEICDSDDDAVIPLKKATFPDYSKAVDRYYLRDFAESEALFAKVLAANANDVPARLFLEKTQNILKNGVPSGWDGVTRYDSKS